MLRITAYFVWDIFPSHIWQDSSLIRSGWHPEIIEGGQPEHTPLPPPHPVYFQCKFSEDTTKIMKKSEIMKCNPLPSWHPAPLSDHFLTAQLMPRVTRGPASRWLADTLSLETCNLRHVTAYGLKYCPIWDSFFTAESTLKFIRTMKCSIFASEQVWKTSTTGYLHLFAIYTFSGFSSPFSSLGPVLCCRPFPFLTLR